MVTGRAAFRSGFVAGSGVSQSTEVHDRSALSTGTPELSERSQVMCVQFTALLGGRIRAEQVVVDLLCQRGRGPVTVQPKPAVLVVDDGVAMSRLGPGDTGFSGHTGNLAEGERLVPKMRPDKKAGSRNQFRKPARGADAETF